MHCLLVLGGLFLGMTAMAGARTLPLSDAPIQIRLHPLQPTALTLPEPIAAIPTGADPATLSLEAVGPHLFLQALGPQVQGRLFLVGASGRLYTVHFAVGDKADAQVVIEPPVAAPAPSVVLADADSASVLLRFMRGDHQPLPPGITVKPEAQVLRDDARWHLVTTQVYSSRAWRGYVATLRNKTEDAQRLDLRAFTAPGLQALSAETFTLPPHGATQLYLLFGRP